MIEMLLFALCELFQTWALRVLDFVIAALCRDKFAFVI